ncbi:MAG: SMC-Scp complex subunit ScpB [Eubacteriales bacterium]|nr:SMC-Scp complex subunit ScpB [Eubacteriales bacterium]MDD3883040.1 SMC-Scp complex subunit ScpB [Eubacteriales bacterium]MDD4513633.1 SMC-Scp complex subunit ScpB [Eubacteriales bacterium]
MQAKETAHIIEAILFVAGEPVMLSDLRDAVGVTDEELREGLTELDNEYTFARRGIILRRFGEHVQLSTRPEYAEYVERLLQPVQKQSLSQSAMETLAIIAYRQPCTRSEIEAVRGVKCDYSVQSLALKGLIAEAGRKDTVGHPILYATTDKFLSHFGIADLSQLPELPQANEEENGASEISGDDSILISDAARDAE